MPMVLSPPEQRVVLRNLSWETYERLLSDHADSSSPRFTFDCGVLEIMSPLAEHERYNIRIADFVGVLADEMDIEVEGFGSTTFKRKELKRGFEPDSCFYVQSIDRVRGKDTLDPAVDPPPDLVIEIEITSSAVEKLPVFAAFGVPEVWRYDGDRLTILRLTRDHYVESEESAVFPGVSSAGLGHLLRQGKSLSKTGWIRLVRAHVRERLRNSR